jgi:hypothetical protein
MMKRLSEELDNTPSIDDKVAAAYKKVLEPINDVNDLLILLTYSNGMNDLHSFVPLTIPMLVDELSKSKNFLVTNGDYFI